MVLKVLTENMFFYAGTAHTKKAKISSVLMAKKPLLLARKRQTLNSPVLIYHFDRKYQKNYYDTRLFNIGLRLHVRVTIP